MIGLQSGLSADSQWVELLTSQVKVLVILVSVTGSGWWYQTSWSSSQMIFGMTNSTSFGTNLHSCQVTGSQASVPAQT